VLGSSSPAARSDSASADANPCRVTVAQPALLAQPASRSRAARGVSALPEQRAIAEVLGALDDKIEVNERMNATLDAMARALFKSWFVDFDPVRAKAEGRAPSHMDAATAALFPDSFEDSSMGPIPAGWRAGTIGDVVTVGGGSTPRTNVPEYWDGTNAWATPKDMSALQAPILSRHEQKDHGRRSGADRDRNDAARHRVDVVARADRLPRDRRSTRSCESGHRSDDLREPDRARVGAELGPLQHRRDQGTGRRVNVPRDQ